jgi:hypothetical protein
MPRPFGQIVLVGRLVGGRSSRPHIGRAHMCFQVLGRHLVGRCQAERKEHALHQRLQMRLLSASCLCKDVVFSNLNKYGKTFLLPSLEMILLLKSKINYNCFENLLILILFTQNWVGKTKQLFFTLIKAKLVFRVRSLPL